MADINIGQKIWSMADVLRDAGIKADQYLDQITLLLFVKMVGEMSSLPDAVKSKTEWGNIDLPEGYSWAQLKNKKGAELLEYYSDMLKTFGNPTKTKGMLYEIYSGSENKISNSALLASVINKIDEINWSSQSDDVKGDIYESLLQRTGKDTKSGAGQYFTPRELINTIVKCVNPKPGKTIADPCCGTGGFLISANAHILKNSNLSSEQLKTLQNSTFSGGELVRDTYRLCLMNMLLHKIGSPNGVPPIKQQDSLANQPSTFVDYVLTNPPFGVKTAQKVEKAVKNKKTGEVELRVEAERDIYNRDDFFVNTSNKQLNFVMHIMSMLKVGGTGAVVLPDNVLTDDNGGAKIRERLLKNYDLHTILRLPSGIFYAQGVKANVLFFEKRPASTQVETKEVWVYDYRTNIHHTLKQNPLAEEHLQDFVQCYNPANRHERTETYNAETNPEGRWRKFSYDDIAKRKGFDLDLKWVTPESDFDETLSIADVVKGLDYSRIQMNASIDKIKTLLADVVELSNS